MFISDVMSCLAMKVTHMASVCLKHVHLFERIAETYHIHRHEPPCKGQHHDVTFYLYIFYI